MMKKKITTTEFDRIFDEGKEDIIQYFDLASAHRLNQRLKRVSLCFPAKMVASLDHEATRLGVTRQSLIKMWLSERLETMR